MKIRSSFISNSSSCSFVVCKSLITDDQMNGLKEWYEQQHNYIDDYGKKMVESENYLKARIGLPDRIKQIIEQLGIPENAFEFVTY